MTELGSIRLVGCGNMGSAMLRRWISAGTDPRRITVIDPGSPPLPDGVRLLHASPIEAVDTLVLAIKPQQLDNFVAQPGGHTRLLISILAGVEEATLAARLSADVIVRAMPNLPVSIGQGVVALHGAAGNETVRASAEALMAPLGLVEWIADEALFDAVTALSGCGPGFVFRFIESLAAAGVALGLPGDQADRLARATVAGAGAMASIASEPLAILADRVASPGGSTRAGLDVLGDDGALKSLIAATLAASAQRNAELAATAR